jgi:hypothetical protein
MRLLAAVDEMSAVLMSADTDAPARQLRGVREWRADITFAVSAGAAFPGAPGKSIDTNRRPTLTRGWAHPEGVLFIFGTPTHRAWRNLCKTIVHALVVQREAAGRQQASALDFVELVERRRKRGIATVADIRRAEAAVIRAGLADEWWLAAASAAASGMALIEREDKIMRPIGLAIKAAGGLTEVAQDKHYHDRAGRQ